MTKGIFTAITAVVIAGTAYAEPAASAVATDEVWACGWTASWGNGATFMTRYEAKGNVLLSGNERQPDQAQYQILANNRYGLVAASAISDERDNHSNVVGSIVMIDNTTGQYRSLSMNLQSGVPDVIKGICMNLGATGK